MFFTCLLSVKWVFCLQRPDTLLIYTAIFNLWSDWRALWCVGCMDDCARAYLYAVKSVYILYAQCLQFTLYGCKWKRMFLNTDQNGICHGMTTEDAMCDSMCPCDTLHVWSIIFVAPCYSVNFYTPDCSKVGFKTLGENVLTLNDHVLKYGIQKQVWHLNSSILAFRK